MGIKTLKKNTTKNSLKWCDILNRGSVVVTYMRILFPNVHNIINLHSVFSP